MARWLTTLAQFDFEVRHVSGKNHIPADFLSRLFEAYGIRQGDYEREESFLEGVELLGDEPEGEDLHNPGWGRGELQDEFLENHWQGEKLASQPDLDEIRRQQREDPVLQKIGNFLKNGGELKGQSRMRLILKKGY